jgi:NAD(P)-dependent dehydrogenase (short-subunit alcohol dehydrogenase family)
MALTGHVALVTGASRGIGRTIAERLAGDGAMVAVHYGSNPAAAAETVQSITNAGGQAFAVHARLDSPGSEIGHEIDRMFAALDEYLTEHTGDARFDILVNNAGVDRFGSIEQITPEIFDQVFYTNVRGPFFLTQRALTRIRDNGRIIYLSSGLARVAVSRHTVYSMTKCAIDKLMAILAQQLGPRGITVNSVAPGAVDTDMTASWLRGNETSAKEVSEMTALGRVGTTRDIADVVAFLASDDGRWVTGNWIDATGGQR